MTGLTENKTVEDDGPHETARIILGRVHIDEEVLAKEVSE